MRTSRRLRGLISGGTAAATVTVASVGLAASPASAAVDGFTNGFTGVTQTISLDATPTMMGQPVCTIQPTINGVAQPTTSGALVNGVATILWTPSTTGVATFSLTDCTTMSTIPTVTISPVPTTAVVAAPDTAKVGVATKVTVTVQSQSPSSTFPSGQVVLKDANGATVQTLALNNTNVGSGQSTAVWMWTPPNAGTYTFKASYNGDANASRSESPLDTTIATTSGSAISLTVPPQFTSGVPVTLVATVGVPGAQGSVGFTWNGQPISASVPLVNGAAAYTWTPPGAGTGTLGANYMTNQGGSGSTTQQITVVSGPASLDVITLVQPGWGQWAPNGTYALGNGTQFTFQASTLSGSPVTLTNTGPCNNSGLSLTIDTGSGQCNLVATSPGGNGYSAVKNGYTVNIIPGTQSATLSIPNSGRVRLKKAYALEGPGQGDTNAGQNITWAIKKGSTAVCRLGFPADGSVTITLVKKGQCMVTGKAPGVGGQWNPYSIARTYLA